MLTAMWPVLIPALALIVTSAATILLTKHKERAAEWRSKKLAYYEEFFGAASGIVGETAPPDAKIRFATSVNNLHLIASNGVIAVLHGFCDEIAESNQHRSRDRHDMLWARLVWEIRRDLNDAPTRTPEAFEARLWASGVTRHNGQHLTEQGAQPGSGNA